jgi:hypothetical protein
VYAQAVAGAGAITGIVKDMYGDGIPDCTVALSNKVIGAKRTVMTSDDGIFDAPGLVPASAYSLKVTRRGYADWELPRFDVSVGSTVNFTITLWADKAATPAEAVGSIAPVQDTKTNLSALVTNDQLYSLPTRGRLPDPLVLLAPAVVESSAGALTFRAEGMTNAFLMDGIEITNRYVPARPGIAPFLSQESIAEMQVLSAGASAEFGHTAGGTINAVTRGGTNNLHAAAYDYYNDHSWNSPDAFASKGFAPTGRLNQGGLSAGLPVSTDTLFLFGDIERVNDASQGLNRITNPLFTDPTGTTVVTTGCTATAAQCTAAANFIKAQMNVKVPTSLISTSGFLRMDFRPNEHENFSMAAAVLSKRSVDGMGDSVVVPNGGLLGANGSITDATRYATFGWTHVISGTSLNEFRGFWLRDIYGATSDSSLLPLNPSQFPAPGPVAINLAGASLGGNPAYPLSQRDQRFGGSDNYTRTIASHTIKVGGYIERLQDTMDQLYARFGMYNYDSFSGFATDFSTNVKQVKNYASYFQTLGSSFTNLQNFNFHGFVQDTWKVSRRFMVTVGGRYEKDRLPQPTSANPLEYQTSRLPSPNTDASPRIGLAYLLDSRTVVRLGGGTYYQPFSGELVRELWADGGIFQTFYANGPADVGATAFPKALTTVAATSSTLAGLIYAAPRFRNPYSEQGTFAIERRVNRYLSAVASYVQNQGVKMFTTTDLNLLGATQTAETYTIDNAQGVAVNTYPETVLSTVSPRNYQVDTEGSSRYRGATAQVRTAPLFGLTVQASYTWSRAIDDVSGPPAISVLPSNYGPGNYRGDTGLSQFDQRNRGVVNWVWQPVVNKSSDVLSRFLLNGWQVSGIATYTSTMYATPLVEVAGQQFTGITMAYPGSLNGSGGWSRVPFENPGILPIGAHSSVDVRVSKALPFTDRLKGVLRFEVFNATNHQNNTAVNTIAYTAVSGVLKPVTGLGTPIADYSYPYGSGARRAQVALRLEF